MRVRALCFAFLVAPTISTGCDQLFSKPSVSVERVDLTASASKESPPNRFPDREPQRDRHRSRQARLSAHRRQSSIRSRRGEQSAAVPAQGVGHLTLPVSFKFTELAEALASLLPSAKCRTRSRLSSASARRSACSRFRFRTRARCRCCSCRRCRSATPPSAARPSGASLSVTVNVHNNNSFALPVGGLQYASRSTARSCSPPDAADAARGERHDAAGVSAHVDFLRVGLGILRAIQSRSPTVALDGSFDLSATRCRCIWAMRSISAALFVAPRACTPPKRRPIWC